MRLGADSIAERFAELLAKCAFGPADDQDPRDRTHRVAGTHCAVSGGADSTALAVLAVGAGLRPTLWHVDHQLRADSAAEAAVVSQLAMALGVQFESRTVTVEAGPNLEARCREARYGVLPVGVMTGHTADDRAETMLLNLMRGAARSGMAPLAPGPTHPIAALRRSETEAVCAELGLDVVQDPTNTDPAFARNRVRHELVPLLNDIAARDVVPAMVRQADLFGTEDAFLDALAEEIDVHDARVVAAAPEVLARRSIRRLLFGLADAGHPPDAASVARVLAVARGEAVGTDVGGGWRVERSAQRLRVVPPTQDGA